MNRLKVKIKRLYNLEEYDIEFRGDDIRGSNTVKDLYDRIESRVG